MASRSKKKKAARKPAKAPGKSGAKTPAAPAAEAPAFVAPPGQLAANRFSLVPTAGVAPWLTALDATLAFTTYQSGQLFLLGRTPDNALIYTVRTFQRAMGVCLDRNQLHLGTQNIIWHFRNVLPPGQVFDGYDALYLPRTSHITGALDVHDMAIEADGRLVFINTIFSVVATPCDGYSFQVVWKPPWITELMPEDRCHLNGLALRDGHARYVTAVSRTDTREGWREVRVGGGVLYDIAEDRPVAENLTMPHSPRWHNGAIYFINSGTGFLCRCDPESGNVTEVCFCPGFTRGLAILGNHAVVGTSHQRLNRTFSDLPLEQNLRLRGVTPFCALHIINLSTGQIEEQIRLEGEIKEIYDIAFLPGVRRPNAIGFLGDEVNFLVDYPPEPAPLRRPS